MIICYHDDLDGRCAAAIILYGLHTRKDYSGEDLKKVRLYPCMHGPTRRDPGTGEIITLGNKDIEIPNLLNPKEDIYLVDFGFSMEIMMELEYRCNENSTMFVWIDHHITELQAAHEFNHNPDGTCNANFDPFGLREYKQQLKQDKDPTIPRDGLSGCELTWNYIFPNDPMVVAIQRLGRFDVWDERHKPAAWRFKKGCESYDTRVENTRFWFNLFSAKEYIERIEKHGALLMKHQDEQNAKAAKRFSFESTLPNGWKAICCNTNEFNSMLFDSVWDPKKYDVMIPFCRDSEGLWTYSMYTTKDDIHCGKYCAQLEDVHSVLTGGGHKQAAGFKATYLIFLKNNMIDFQKENT